MVRAAFDHAAALDDLAGADLGHRARTNRLVHTADLLGRQPAGRSLPDRLPARADYEGALNLANHPAVTHQAVLLPHALATRQRMLDCPGVVLVVHDLTELDFSGLRVPCLGPIGNGGGRGFECHNSLALDFATGDLLGLTSQILHVRDDDALVEARRLARQAATGASATGAGRQAGRRRDEPPAECFAREGRESRLWVRGCEALGDVPEGRLWVDVCDRAADTFEYLLFMARRNRSYVIRSKHDRALDEGEVEAEAGEGGGKPVRLRELMRGLPGTASWQVSISANKKQVARTAAVTMAWRRVRVEAPDRWPGEHDGRPLDAWAIRVWEPDPPEGVKEPLEWLLLTNVPVRDDTQARERVAWYERRPVVEEFHKAQKTGMGMEGMQLQTRSGLEPLVGLLSILAVALVNLRGPARREGADARPAREVVDPLWVKVLSVRMHGEERELGVREFTLGLARLGGYMNRRRGAWPGWIVLWRGLTKLLNLVEYESARAKCPQRSPEH